MWLLPVWLLPVWLLPVWLLPVCHCLTGWARCVRLYQSDFGPCKKSIVKGVESDPFDHFITGTIILNTLAMCVEYHNQASVQLTQFCKDSVLSVLQPESMTQVMTMLNYIFTGIFAIEAFLKVQQRLQLNSLH